MKKFLVALCALALMASCREFEPVFTGKYKDTEREVGVSDEYALAKFGVEKFTTINALKSKYLQHGKPIEFDEPFVIRGEVTSSDESGNVYRELYIQDASGAIDFKVGRSSSYDDYKVGQILYINCQGLTLGEYGFKDRNYYGSGQLQLGLKRNTAMDLNKGEWVDADEYETSYIDLEPILRSKVLKGVILPAEERIKPKTNVTGAEILSYGYEEIVVDKKTPTDFQKAASINHPLVGMLVELKGLQYADEVFALFYPNPNLNHTSSDAKNRLFVSKPDSDETWNAYDYTYGLRWWAITKNRFSSIVESVKETLPAGLPFSSFQQELNKTITVYTVKEEGGSTVVEETTMSLVEYLESKSVMDVCDLLSSTPANFITDITSKVPSYKTKQAERIQMFQSVVSDIIHKIDQTPELLTNAEWYALVVGSGSDHFGCLGKAMTDEEFFGVKMPYLDLVITYPSAQSVSQYFDYQGSPVAIRTSGYARFADLEIPASVLAGEESIDVVGILGRYQGSPQITMLDAWLSSDTSHSTSILNQ